MDTPDRPPYRHPTEPSVCRACRHSWEHPRGATVLERSVPSCPACGSADVVRNWGGVAGGRVGIVADTTATVVINGQEVHGADIGVVSRGARLEISDMDATDTPVLVHEEDPEQ